MKKIVLLLVLFMGGNFAYSAPNSIATVDVKKVVKSSPAVKDLKVEQQDRMRELQNFVVNAKKEIDAEGDLDKRKLLEEKYTKQITQKAKAVEKNYARKSQAADRKITKTISNIAEAGNFGLVLSNKAVLYGGQDITDTVIEAGK
ncbi:MAG: hypothetical protein DKM22_06690 [Candidatus Melainabacteria bacterium]|nr:MAG: hypothetical protein DKM22_06690 [Candidatus Melainabacteria bacterium]